MAAYGMNVTTVGTARRLWRYPVKSLAGEALDAADITTRGVALDRWWSVVGADGKLGSGKTTRRFRHMPGLLSMQSFIHSGMAYVQFPDGSMGRVDDPAIAERVAAVVGEPVTLSPEHTVRHFDDGPIHLLTTGSLAWLRAMVPRARIDARRFRPNILVETESVGRVEESWIGSRIAIGEVRLMVTSRAIRCVMVTMPQADLDADPGILRALERENDLCLGVYAIVERPGHVKVGAPVRHLTG
jgi:uncharacterized protein YcbX